MEDIFIPQAAPAVPKQKCPTIIKSPEVCRVIASIPSAPSLPKLNADVQFPVAFITAIYMSVSPDKPSAPKPISWNKIAEVKEPATTVLPSSKTTCPASRSSSNPPPETAQPKGPSSSSATDTSGRTITKTTVRARMRRISSHLLLSLEVMA